MNKLKEIITEAEKKKTKAYEKYRMGGDNIPISRAMEYYIDLSNAFTRLLNELKDISEEKKNYPPTGDKPYNEKAEFAVEILKQYAGECGTLPRSTSDLSPLEQWLIIKLLKTTKASSVIGKSLEDLGDKITSREALLKEGELKITFKEETPPSLQVYKVLEEWRKMCFDKGEWISIAIAPQYEFKNLKIRQFESNEPFNITLTFDDIKLKEEE